MAFCTNECFNADTPRNQCKCSCKGKNHGTGVPYTYNSDDIERRHQEFVALSARLRAEIGEEPDDEMERRTR
jgi:hypothetical protein